jgi:hypothetical protein
MRAPGLPAPSRASRFTIPRRPGWLYFEARALAVTFALFGATGVVAGGWCAVRAADDSLSGEVRVEVPVLLLASALSAMLCGVAVSGHLRWLERVSPRSLAPWRMRHAVLPCLGATIALLPAGAFGGQGFGIVFAARNTCALIGLALAGAAVIGARLSWLPPLLYVTVSLYSGGDRPPLWAVVLSSSASGRADAVCAGAAIAGIAVYVRYGER